MSRFGCVILGLMREAESPAAGISFTDAGDALGGANRRIDGNPEEEEAERHFCDSAAGGWCGSVDGIMLHCFPSLDHWLLGGESGGVARWCARWMRLERADGAGALHGSRRKKWITSSRWRPDRRKMRLAPDASRAEEGPEDLVAGSSGGCRGRWTATGSAGGEEDKQ